MSIKNWSAANKTPTSDTPAAGKADETSKTSPSVKAAAQSVQQQTVPVKPEDDPVAGVAATLAAKPAQAAPASKP